MDLTFIFEFYDIQDAKLLYAIDEYSEWVWFRMDFIINVSCFAEASSEGMSIATATDKLAPNFTKKPSTVPEMPVHFYTHMYIYPYGHQA